MAESKPTDFDLDFLMACRFAYYCRAYPIIEDTDYDEREAEYCLLNGPLPVGSSKPEDYTDAQRALALYFMLSGRVAMRRKPRAGVEPSKAHSPSLSAVDGLLS